MPELVLGMAYFLLEIGQLPAVWAQALVRYSIMLLFLGRMITGWYAEIKIREALRQAEKFADELVRIKHQHEAERDQRERLEDMMRKYLADVDPERFQRDD